MHGHRVGDLGFHLFGEHTVDAVLGAGAIKETMRTIWQLGQVRVNDGGPDGVVSTTPNTLFAVQGLFVP